MLSSFLAMQNAVIMNNIANANMINASDRMINSVSFGNSQPLRPAISNLSADELCIKANETRSAATIKLLDSLKKCIPSSIQRSTPKYAGLDYKA